MVLIRVRAIMQPKTIAKNSDTTVTRIVTSTIDSSVGKDLIIYSKLNIVPMENHLTTTYFVATVKYFLHILLDLSF